MKHIFYIFLAVLLASGCRRQPSDADALLTQCIVRGDSTLTARNFYEAGLRLCPGHQSHDLAEVADSLPLGVAPDSALHLFLFAADYAKGSSDHTLNYNIQRQLALQYEAKNLFSLQQEAQQAMLSEARKLADPYRMAEATQQMAITTLALGAEEPSSSRVYPELAEGVGPGDAVLQAQRLARQAYADAPRDSVEFRAETLLFLAQTYIAASSLQPYDKLRINSTQDKLSSGQAPTDSAAYFLQRAAAEWPAVVETDLYRLSSIYIHAREGRTDEALQLIAATPDVYARMEAWRAVKDVAEERGQTPLRLQAADAMLALADTIAELEASETTARIHAIQHADALRLLKAEQAADAATVRSRWLLVLLLLSLLLGGSAWWALTLRRKAYTARMNELEALRLAAEAQKGESAVREENMQLQKRYYDHLFAILLPILNACRKKRGHIDLGEDSWRLIEENTDLVLPGFTAKLRRQNPGLTTDDIRFCCLVAMRVPNSIMAEIYAIAPSSVAVRKQRMKKKFDDRQAEQSLDNYLTQYS